MDVTLRKSKSEDWKIIQQLNAEVYENSIKFDPYIIPNDPFTKESEVDYQQSVSDPTKFCMIAEIAGKPVGYLFGGEHNYSYRSNRRGEIFHMGISPLYRSHGIGTILIAKFKKWCSEQKLTHIGVNTYFNDLKGRNFYEKQGLKPIDVTLGGPID